MAKFSKKNPIASHIIVFILLPNGTKLSAYHILDRRENDSNYDLEQHRKIAMFQNQKNRILQQSKTEAV